MDICVNDRRSELERGSLWPLGRKGFGKLECDHSKNAPCHGSLVDESRSDHRREVGLGPYKDTELGICGPIPDLIRLAKVDKKYCSTLRAWFPACVARVLESAAK